jgi:catechol 2,3-dioxygenase-like lactoylglutathione lyase family enzyme
MSSAQTRPINMALEVVVIPVADVDRSVRFYSSLGWRLDADLVKPPAFRLVQFTPPGSACSIHFGQGVTSSTPGSEGGLYLVVSDVAAAREALLARGVAVSELLHRSPSGAFSSGADPQRQSHAFVSFKDPDGNTWIVQEVIARLPGRVAPDAVARSQPT